MKIDSSMIGMESARSYASVTSKTASASLKGGVVSQGREMTNGFFSGMLNAQEEGESVESAVSNATQVQSYKSFKSVSSVHEIKTMETVRQQCVLFLLRWLCNNLGNRRMQGQQGQQGQQLQNQQIPGYQNQADSIQKLAPKNIATAPQFRMSADYYHAEIEKTTYSTMGIVRTADGRQINFNLNLSMSRGFEEYYGINASNELPRMTDPLVINLDTDMASLSDQRFEFDIDSDGIKDSIPYLKGGSGYLALDKNGDGVIGDGSELFGTQSGDGFRDLAQYDQDGNGWIDENDEIFEKLLVWTKDENGNDVLYTLKQAGVGAICLQKADTEFSLNSLKNNQTNGRIRSTGIFLYENGGVGTMQQLDLAQ